MIPRFGLLPAFLLLCKGAGVAAVGIPAKTPMVSATGKLYPPLDAAFPGIECLHAEPPVFLVHDFLSQEQCEALVAAAKQEQLAKVEYQDAVLLDRQRLLLLLPLLLCTPLPSVAKLLEAVQGDWALIGAKDIAAAVAAPIAGGALAAAALIQIVTFALTKLTGGKIFTGTKFSTASIDATKQRELLAVVEAAKQRAASLCCTTKDHLEVPTVTRYLPGELQRRHNDARPAGDPDNYDVYMKNGGQRMVQVLTYLNTLAPEDGGETRFWDPKVGGGLRVHPRKGMALVFFPAFEDGSMDPRMPHSGEPVVSGVKWTLNTWVTQYPTS